MPNLEKSYSILIVDDLPKNIQLLGNMLSEKNYRIAYATNGEKALILTKKFQFDLILLDIMMPEMDGYEVCRQLKNCKKTQEIPVIFLTAKTDPDSIVQGFASGGQDYVTKPFNGPELLARVETHLLLKDRNERLKELNETLEEKVAERTQALKLANQRLRSLEQAKSDFLALISHELRTPLNGLVGMTELLHCTVESEEQQEYIKHLRLAIQRLIKFSDMALLITRIKAEKYNLMSQTIPIKNLIDDSIIRHQAEITTKHIIVETASMNDSTTLIGDPFLLSKVIDHILHNAITYSPANGIVHIDCQIKGSQLQSLSIRDHGPGFPPELLTWSFTFFAVDDVMHHSEGLGLSLAMSKLIMEAHQGSIRIQNLPDGGAEVQLLF